jgi:hypothetical protein
MVQTDRVRRLLRFSLTGDKRRKESPLPCPPNAIAAVSFPRLDASREGQWGSMQFSFRMVTAYTDAARTWWVVCVAVLEPQVIPASLELMQAGEVHRQDNAEVTVPFENDAKAAKKKYFCVALRAAG